MADDLRLYDVAVGGHRTQMRLNDEDAARLGADAVPAAGQPPRPADHAPADAETRVKNRLVTSNKMRGTDSPTPETEHLHHA